MVALAVVVDTFDTGDEEITVPAGNTWYTTTVGSGILGGERDIELTSSGSSTNLNFSLDQLNISGFTPNAYFTAVLTWDGDDGDPTKTNPIGSEVLSKNGLGGSSGNGELDVDGNDGFLLTITAKDNSRVKLTFGVYEYGGSNDYASYSITLSGSPIFDGSPVDVFFPFASFSNYVNVDFGNVGAVILEVSTVGLDPAADISIDALDTDNVREFGDLPVGIYGTSVLEASHVPTGLTLGNKLDTEDTYQSSTNADGDDLGDTDDEDGVSFYFILDTSIPGYDIYQWRALINVQGCGGSCYLNAWMDKDNQNGFGTTSEYFVQDENITSDGVVDRVAYSWIDGVGEPIAKDYYYFRFRVCKDDNNCDTVTELSSSGEVEDYYAYFNPTAVELAAFTAVWDAGAVQVDWVTSLEIDSADGKYSQVNSAFIPTAAPGSTEGGLYAFTNTGVVPGTTYFYKLEEIENGGVSNWYGPVETAVVNPNAVTLAGLPGRAAFGWAGLVLLVGTAGGFVLFRKRR
ncbi:MAG: hypothetical protein P1S60_04110 [Anaerolineae bacterium]|nr:hypothetical protein [Anaerolineae bacterium]